MSSAGAPISQEIRLPTNVGEVGQAVGKLDQLIARVEKLERVGERQRKKHEEGWRGVGKSIDEAKNKTHEFFEFVGAVAAFEVLEKIADKFVEIGKEAVTAAAKAERMNFAIDAAAGGKERGKQVREWLEANAKFSEFSESVNESAYLSMKRFGVDDRKAGLYMKAAEDLSAMAAPDERLGVYQEALSAFQRMHARGKLDTRSAMRLGLGVEDFAALPQFQGMSKKAIAKAMQSGSGNVTENDILNMIVKHTGESGIGERSAEASQLLLTRMTKLTELPERFFKRLGETTAVKKLASEIGDILEKLDPESPTGRRISAFLEETFDKVADAIGGIDWEGKVELLTEAFEGFADIAKPILKFIDAELEGWAYLIAKVTGHAAEFDQRMAARAKAEKEATAKKEARERDRSAYSEDDADLDRAIASGALGARSAAETAGAAAAAKAYDQARKHGKAISVGEAEGITEGSERPVEAAGTMADETQGIVKRKHKIKSPSRVFRDMGEQDAEGFALGLEGGEDRIAAAMDSTLRVPAARYVGPTTTTAARAIGRSVTFGDINIDISLPAGGNPDTAGAIRDELRRSLKPMFVDVLEEALAEGDA